MATKYAYLANAAIAPIPMPVYKVSKFYEEVLNQGQRLWDEWESKMEQTRDLYAKFIGADDRDEIGFTHSYDGGRNIFLCSAAYKSEFEKNSAKYGY
ncbi:MAG: aminotransferase class V-fold PLP-dependent enzyme [Candidatus Nitrosopolaris sp.]